MEDTESLGCAYISINITIRHIFWTSLLNVTFGRHYWTSLLEFGLFDFFDASKNKNIVATIRIGREIWCLPYAEF